MQPDNEQVSILDWNWKAELASANKVPEKIKDRIVQAGNLRDFAQKKFIQADEELVRVFEEFDPQYCAWGDFLPDTCFESESENDESCTEEVVDEPLKKK